MEYSKHVQSLGEVILELLSEALGLDPDHLKDIGCSEGYAFHCQYYPACPEPNRTLGVGRHRDPDFFTILVQNQIQGLQVLHRDHWIYISPMEGAVIVNIGDLLQLISNDKFKSVDHRVLATSVGPRVSLVCLFTTDLQPSDKVYAPLKELLSPNIPALYKGTTIPNYLKTYVSKPGNGLSVLKFDHQKTSPTEEDQVYDRAKAVKAFDDTKASVQGLVDAGIAKLPPFFYMSPEVLHDHPTLTDPYLHSDFQEERGFFRVINHGIPQHVLKEVLDGVRRFHEQPRESKGASWKDTLICVMAPDIPPPEKYPFACRASYIGVAVGGPGFGPRPPQRYRVLGRTYLWLLILSGFP
ncbi:1-aminocyclopropane-1-carboxylate oxidase-like protein 1 [Hibiscus syriacus]|uniref:1-aminocyclopropane-1-carboxylate oxidase-like protein 1 n=1 Tax=Hibiscus syriacus TaxID=106335 RepID=A0A6A2WQ98_HIBSY|nr:1-aminocyclopropane-1-carboxylate oxidase-like protein 1 [Hibiscus syriacus]